MNYISRTRIKKEIVSEFIPPARKSDKVIILCSGAPGYPNKKEFMFFLAEKGYWVFSPRYRGTWESDGWFLEKSLHLDVLDVIDSLSKGFVDLWSGERHRIKNPKIYLIGSSFGGPAVILASKDKRVKKAIAVSSVIDWREETKLEPLDWLEKFIKSAFGNGYRFKKKDWAKLKKGNFYNPISEIKKLDGKKIYIIHSLDDEVVCAKATKKFAKSTGCKLTLLRKGGHISPSILMKAPYWKKTKEFFH